MTINSQFGKSEILEKSSISISAANVIVGEMLDHFSDILKYSIELPTTQKQYDEMFSFGGIGEKEKAILTKNQLKELEETGMLEGEFIYDENGNPTSFRSIDDIELIDDGKEAFLLGLMLDLPTDQENFRTRFGRFL